MHWEPQEAKDKSQASAPAHCATCSLCLLEQPGPVECFRTGNAPMFDDVGVGFLWACA